MKRIFINSNTGIIRAGWRIVIFLLIFLSLDISLSFGIREILGSLKGGGTIWFTILGISATIAVYVSRKYIDKASLNSLGLEFDKMAILDVIMGVLINAVIIGGIYFTLLYAGQIKFEGYTWWHETNGSEVGFNLTSITIMISMIWRFMIVAWWEELAFRGIILQNIHQGLNLKWAVILSTIIFAAIHFSNPSATILSTVLIMLAALTLVYAYLKSGQLWLAMGLHLGWNFFQASVFGFPSSGHVSPTLISQSPIGPDWLSGGEFGAEHSILIIPFVLVSFALINWWVGRTRQTKEDKFFTFLIHKRPTNQKEISSLNTEVPVES